MPLAIFGIEDDGINLAVNLLILFLVVLYLALIAYTYLDARRRLEDPVLVACATVASLFPFVGTVIYSILRPPEFIADRRERELETEAAELQLRQLREAACPNCAFPVERSFLRCPSCKARIKEPCESCGKAVDPRWPLCPYCETPTRRAAAPERRTASRSAAPAAKRPATAAGRASRAKRPVTRSAETREARAVAKSRPASKPRTATPRRKPSAPDPGEDGPRKAPAS